MIKYKAIEHLIRGWIVVHDNPNRINSYTLDCVCVTAKQAYFEADRLNRLQKLKQLATRVELEQLGKRHY